MPTWAVVGWGWRVGLWGEAIAGRARADAMSNRAVAHSTVLTNGITLYIIPNISISLFRNLWIDVISLLHDSSILIIKIDTRIDPLNRLFDFSRFPENRPKRAILLWVSYLSGGRTFPGWHERS